MRYDKVLKELYSLESPKIRPGLKRVLKLLKKMGDPQESLKCIHVAGTNGKGSACAFLHSILDEAGYKTGLYTSPHLKRFNERIKIDDELISDSDIIRLYKKIKPHITNQSFFEITTAMAFLYFSEKKADIVVLEVGLGGRLDATNVITPLISVITNIGLEHTNILGNTIGKIAYEKSGIIKEGVPLACGAEGKALSVIKKYATNKNAPAVSIQQKHIHSKYNKKTNSWVFDYKQHKMMELRSMKGHFQLRNAAIALEVCDILKKKHAFDLNQKSIQRGIYLAHWPGRMELRGNVLIDCAHNAPGFETLASELNYFNYDKLIMVLGFSDDKDIKKIARLVGKKADTIVLTQSHNEKAARIDEIRHYFANPILIKNPKKALLRAKKEAKKEDLVLVAGSIYMVGEII